jgi:hypothetical protein
MFTDPSVHDVGIDTVLQCHSSNGRARLCACLDNLQLEFSAVEPALRNFGGASVARHGVHDVHRAHYLNSSVCLQDGMASRLRITSPVLGFKTFWSAQRLIAGIETMHMVKKGQLHCPNGQAISATEQFYSLAF